MKQLIGIIALLIATSITFAQSNIQVPGLKLNNGLEMPQFGLGTYLLSNDVARKSALEAIKNGYRHIDAANMYRNEEGVGEAIKESGVPRDQIWITSKIWPGDYGEGKTMAAIDATLKRFQIDYIDLLYLHQAYGDIVGAWKDLEKAVAQGKVRSLGISNFDVDDKAFHTIVDSMKIKPVALQTECHPYAQRLDIRKKLEPYHIVLEAWYPLGHGDKGLLGDSVISKTAKAHNKTAAQVIIRWHIQEGHSVIPGSSNPAHIKENIEVFDFALNDEEMKAMRSLNKEKRFFDMKGFYDRMKSTEQNEN